MFRIFGSRKPNGNPLDEAWAKLPAEIQRQCPNGYEDLRPYVSRRYDELTRAGMKVAKHNLDDMIYLAKAIEEPGKVHDGMRWEFRNLCMAIENIACELYCDAIREYNACLKSGRSINEARPYVAEMKRALSVLAIPLQMSGAQVQYHRSNYSYWRVYVMNCEQELAAGSFFSAR